MNGHLVAKLVLSRSEKNCTFFNSSPLSISSYAELITKMYSYLPQLAIGMERWSAIFIAFVLCFPNDIASCITDSDVAGSL